MLFWVDEATDSGARLGRDDVLRECLMPSAQSLI